MFYFKNICNIIDYLAIKCVEYLVIILENIPINSLKNICNIIDYLAIKCVEYLVIILLEDIRM